VTIILAPFPPGNSLILPMLMTSRHPQYGPVFTDHVVGALLLSFGQRKESASERKSSSFLGILGGDFLFAVCLPFCFFFANTTPGACTRVDAALSSLLMSSKDQRKSQGAIDQGPQAARFFRAWEELTPDQKEDLIYLAQSMVNRNRRERRNVHKSFARAA
jgi:hypothetical protein